MNCKYCVVHSNNNNTQVSLDLEEVKKVIKKFSQFYQDKEIKNIEISFTGGEPLIYFDKLKKIVEYSEKMMPEINISYAINTNTVLLTKKVCEFLKKYDFFVSLSLDGLKKDNDEVRIDYNVEETFDKIFESIKLLRKYGVDSESISLTLTKNNLYFDYRKFIDFLLESNFTNLRIEPDLLKELPLNSEELAEYFFKLESMERRKE